MDLKFLTADWAKLIMANYVVDPELLIPFLPKGVELDDFQGKQMVSLVGFMFLKTSIFRIPVPFLGDFEEVNLRFYVKRKVDGQWRRGVVFVNESVPYGLVAWIANALYKEHYSVLKTWHSWKFSKLDQQISYNWEKSKQIMELSATGQLVSQPMKEGSEEHFIFEHYYGYTLVSSNKTWEYNIQHPNWNVFPVTSFNIDCDFGLMYGQQFQRLNQQIPDSVFLAEGSKISVGFERAKI